MTNKSLNLTYSNRLFSDIFDQKKIIEKTKDETTLHEFTQEDKTEIARGDSYAYFPELKEHVAQGHAITIEDFMKTLDAKGVSDPLFQNKVLCMILQNKLGIQFGLVQILNGLLMSKGGSIISDQSSLEISLEVNNPNNINLNIEGKIQDLTDNDVPPQISFSICINITPDMVAITDFTLTQMSNSPTADSAFKFLEDNQQNILEKILSYIKRFFGFNSELRLEENTDNRFSWSC